MKQQPAQLLLSLAREIVDKDPQARKQGRKDGYFNCQLEHLRQLIATESFRQRIQNTPHRRMRRYNIALHFNPTTNIRGNNNSVANHQDKSQKVNRKNHVDENHDKSRKNYELTRPSNNPPIIALRRDNPMATPWREPHPDKPQASKPNQVKNNKTEQNRRGGLRAGSKKRRGDRDGKAFMPPVTKPKLPQAPLPKHTRQHPDNYLNNKINLPAQPTKQQQQQTQLGFNTRGGLNYHNNTAWENPNRNQAAQFNYPQPDPTPMEQLQRILVNEVPNNKSGSSRQRTPSRRGFKQKCYFCHAEGHWARNCYKRQNTQHGTRM